MSRRHYLYVSSSGLIALRDQSDGLSLSLVCERPPAAAGDDAGATDAPWLRPFEALLARHRRDVFVWLVDTVEEELHFEQVPRVRGNDLRKIVSRRLEQRFRDRRLSTWLPAGAGQAGGWRSRLLPSRGQTMPVVLSALAGDKTLHPWLAVALRMSARIEGVHSPALLSRNLARRITPEPNGLLVSLHPGGLRQTLLIDGQARFTRLAALAMPVDATQVVAESVRVMQYLMMSQTLSRDRMSQPDFRMWVLGDGMVDPARLPAFAVLDNASRVMVEKVDAATLRAPHLLGASVDPAAGIDAQVPAAPFLGALAVWLQPVLFARRLRGYADEQISRHAVSAARERTALSSAALLLGLGLLANVGVSVQHLFDESAPRSAALLAHDQREKVALERELARYPAPGGEMRQLVELAGELRARRVDAALLLNAVAEAMGEDESLTLNRLAWARGDLQDNGTDPSRASGTGTAAPLAMAGTTPITAAASGRPGASVAAFGTAPAAAMAGTGTAGPAAIGNAPARVPVTVRLAGGFADQPAMTQANARVEGFAARLGRLCGCEARVRKLPFDPEPTQGYTGRLKKSETEAIGFELEMTWDRAGGATIVGGSDARKG